MKDLLVTYKNTLKKTLKEMRIIENGGSFNYADPQALYEVLKAAEKDLRFAILWLEKGYQPDGHYRGIQKNDAYYVMRPYDPVIIERYMENKNAKEPFEFIEESYASIEEMQERKRIALEDSLPKEKMAAIRKAKKELDDFEMQVVLLSEQGQSVREIGTLLGVNHMKVQRTKNKCRQKIEDILFAIEQAHTDKKTFICHCEVRANDGQSHITAKPTVPVEANGIQEATRTAIQQLEEQYRKLGCVWVDVEIPLIREG